MALFTSGPAAAKPRVNQSDLWWLSKVSRLENNDGLMYLDQWDTFSWRYLCSEILWITFPAADIAQLWLSDPVQIEIYVSKYQWSQMRRDFSERQKFLALCMMPTFQQRLPWLAVEWGFWPKVVESLNIVWLLRHRCYHSYHSQQLSEDASL